jgi:hypothetical protein
MPSKPARNRVTPVKIFVIMCLAPFVMWRGLHPSEALSRGARQVSECRVTNPSRLPCKAPGNRWYSNPVAC